MSRALLTTSENYDRWRITGGSSLLVLSGRTLPEGRSSRGYTHSWLSPALTYIAEDHQEDMMAYFCCHPGARAEEHAGKIIFCTLLYQILKVKPDILRKKDQQFRNLVQSDLWQRPESDKPAVQMMFSMLREVLHELKALGMVYLILDRIDLCSWKLRYVMSELNSLVTDDRCAVKIVVVVDEVSASLDVGDVLELEEEGQDSKLVYAAWNQRPLTLQEIQKQSRSYLTSL